MWARLSALSVPSLAVVVVLWAAALIARAARYWILLELRAGLWAVTLVTLLRNLVVDVLPLRIGSVVAYLYAVIRRLGLPADVGVASFAVASVLDTLALAPLALLAVLVLGAGPLPPEALGVAGVLVLLGAVALLVLLSPMLNIAGRVVARCVPSPATVGSSLVAAATVVRRLDTGRVLLPALGLSLAVRLSRYGALYYLLHAVLPA
jgi:hypothetical protein